MQDNYLDFVQDQAEWEGTDIVFDISDTAAGTQVRFTHVGLAPGFECYDVCSDAWGSYLDGSLRDLILTGQGQPNPTERDAAAAPAGEAAFSATRSARSPV